VAQPAISAAAAQVTVNLAKRMDSPPLPCECSTLPALGVNTY
jgi:hypothetical protein